jgi:hypothetical protein
MAQETTQTSYAAIAATTISTPAPQLENTPQMTNYATTENENSLETQQTDLEHEKAPRIEKNLQNPPSDPTSSRTTVEYPKENSGEQQTKDNLEEGREDPMDLSEPQESMTKQEEETSEQDSMPNT